MSEVRMNLPVVRGFGETARRDRWWVQPLIVFVVLSSFIGYATWAAFQGDNYFSGPYLSPFYSPALFHEKSLIGSEEHSWFGAKPAAWPSWLIFSPALLILPFPGGFRFTCYYYRGAYYKAFWSDPPSCTVGEPRNSYWGERSLPLVLQNLHRYFLYMALLFLVFLAYDVWKALWFRDLQNVVHFGVGIGTLVLLVNVILLGGYTLGCHSLRHLVGGALDQLSRAPKQKRVYDCVSCLNRRHHLWAWCSLFWVAFSDIYVRLCAMGIWTDWNTVTGWTAWK